MVHRGAYLASAGVRGVSVVDLPAIAAALGDLYQRFPHLPRRGDLARIVRDAYHDPGLPPDSLGRLPAVVAALWPIGAAAGAERGHTVMAAAIRDEVSQALADPTLSARARWVVTNFDWAAANLPPTPATRHYTLADSELRVGKPATLGQALTIGLDSSWRAGHRDATEQILTAFADRVVDLVGHDDLTRPLVPTLTGDDLLDEIAFIASETAVADREHPSPRPARLSPPAEGPAAARAFAPLRRVGPVPRNEPSGRYQPQTGPGRPRPRR